MDPRSIQIQRGDRTIPGAASPSEAPVSNQVMSMAGHHLKSIYDLRNRLREANIAVGGPAVKDSEGQKENERGPQSLIEITAASLGILRDCHEELSNLFNTLGI